MSATVRVLVTNPTMLRGEHVPRGARLTVDAVTAWSLVCNHKAKPVGEADAMAAEQAGRAELARVMGTVGNRAR